MWGCTGVAAVIKGAGEVDLGEGSASGGVLPGHGGGGDRDSGPDPAGGWLGRPARLGPWPSRTRGLVFLNNIAATKNSRKINKKLKMPKQIFSV